MLKKWGFLHVFVPLMKQNLDSLDAFEYGTYWSHVIPSWFKLSKFYEFIIFFLQNPDLIFKHRLWKRQRIRNFTRQLLWIYWQGIYVQIVSFLFYLPETKGWRSWNQPRVFIECLFWMHWFYACVIYHQDTESY